MNRSPSEAARIDREIAACLHPTPEMWGPGPWPLWLLAMGLADWEAERWLIEQEQSRLPPRGAR